MLHKEKNKSGKLNSSLKCIGREKKDGRTGGLVENLELTVVQFYQNPDIQFITNISTCSSAKSSLTSEAW
jgi:hypothetical protein